MDTLLVMLRNLGMARLVAMGVVAAALVGFFIFIGGRVGGGNLELLYGDLDVKDSGEIVNELESRNVPYELRAGGTQILVPAGEVQKLRLALAGQGLPSGGSIGYEIFDRSDSLGTTTFVQNINLVRALEGELARTIRSFDRVDAARVHLVLPRRELFSRTAQEPSASVVLKTRGAGRLEKGQIQAIQQLVAAAVPGLSTNRIAVMDDSGNLLARSKGAEGDEAGSDSDFEEFRANLETRLRNSIESLLEQSVGFGNVRAEVAADIDFDRVTENNETFDPDGQVVRSTQTIEDTGKVIDRTGIEPVTVAGNLPETAALEQLPATNTTENSRIEETINYEISRSTKTMVHESSIINRLTVAVLVDGTYTTDESGAQIYNPRTEEELAQYAALVRSAIGFDQARGDLVEVVNMQFATVEVPEVIETTAFFGLTKEDYFQIAEFLLISVVAVLIILLVLRPLVARAVNVMAATAQAAAEANQMQLAAAEAAAAAATGAGAIAGPEGAPAAAPPSPAEEIESMIDISAIDGQVKASSVKKIGEIIDKHPEEAVSILRTWLYQE